MKNGGRKGKGEGRKKLKKMDGKKTDQEMDKSLEKKISGKLWKQRSSKTLILKGYNRLPLDITKMSLKKVWRQTD